MPDNISWSKRIKNNLIDDLMLNPIEDDIPSVVIPTIQPVYEVDNDFTDFSMSQIVSTTGSNNIISTDTNRDFYLTAVTLSVSASETADFTHANINVTIRGVQRAIVGIAKAALESTNQTITQTFPNPIRVDRGALIRVTCAFTTGTVSIFASANGHYKETPNQFSTG